LGTVYTLSILTYASVAVSLSTEQLNDLMLKLCVCDIYDSETECSFVYLIFAVLLHKFNQW